MQEADAAKTMEGFADMLPPQANVIRDGKVAQVPAIDLVNGDVMQVNMGDKVPADLRMLSVTNLKVSRFPSRRVPAAPAGSPPPPPSPVAPLTLLPVTAQLLRYTCVRVANQSSPSRSPSPRPAAYRLPCLLCPCCCLLTSPRPRSTFASADRAVVPYWRAGCDRQGRQHLRGEPARVEERCFLRYFGGGR